MADADQLMKECFMPFYQRVFAAFKQEHQTMFMMLNSVMSGKKNYFGIRLTENDKPIGDYTLHLQGATISHLESGNLSSEVHTPFGVMRPYVILEKSAIERMIADEENFVRDLFTTKMKYAQDVTIKFL